MKKLMKTSSKNKMRGIGLLELMLSLAIIAILLVMATRYFMSANESQKINNAISQIHGIAGGAANYYVANHSYSGMATDTLVTGHYVPASFNGTGAGAGANPWGGNLTTAAITGGTGGYTVTLTGVPAASCTKLASMLEGNDSGSATCPAGTTTLTVTFH